MYRGWIPALPAFLVLYGTLYAAYGVASPFWPLFFTSLGLSPEQLGLLLAVGTLARLPAGPFIGRLADLTGAPRAALAICAALSAMATIGLLPHQGFLLLILIYACQQAAHAPLTTIADALALQAAKGEAHRRFEYGWVRGAGSAAFVIGTLVAGQVLSYNLIGPSAIAWMHATVLCGVIIAAALVPGIAVPSGSTETVKTNLVIGGFREALRNAAFRRVILVSTLIFSSHAMHDAFAVVRWTAAGIGSVTVSMLWSESVVAEVAVFLLIGPRMITRFGPRGAAVLAGAAGVVRWIVMSQTTDVGALALIQPLHGFTFALLHLACMNVIGASVPPRLAATAQSIYAFGAGVALAVLSYVSGILYGQFGARAFLMMALLCALAIPIALSMPRTRAVPLGHAEEVAPRPSAKGSASPDQ